MAVINPGEHICKKCRKPKPHKQFKNPNGGVTRLRICEDCRSRPERVKKCRQCDGKKPVKEFIRGNKERNTCNACATRRSKTGRIVTAKVDSKPCASCGLVKPMSSFKSGGCYRRDCLECRELQSEARADRMRKAGTSLKVKPWTFKPLCPGWQNLDFGPEVSPFDPQVYPFSHVEMHHVQ